jgi:hypothetical protein
LSCLFALSCLGEVLQLFLELFALLSGDTGLGIGIGIGIGELLGEIFGFGEGLDQRGVLAPGQGLAQALGLVTGAQGGGLLRIQRSGPGLGELHAGLALGLGEGEGGAGVTVEAGYLLAGGAAMHAPRMGLLSPAKKAE